MTLSIDLPAETAGELEQRARTGGLQPSDYVRSLIMADLDRARQPPPAGPGTENAAAIALLQSWIDEAKMSSEEERRQADAEWQAAMRDLDEHRSSPRRLFPNLARPAKAGQTS